MKLKFWVIQWFAFTVFAASAVQAADVPEPVGCAYQRGTATSWRRLSAFSYHYQKMLREGAPAIKIDQNSAPSSCFRAYAQRASDHSVSVHFKLWPWPKTSSKPNLELNGCNALEQTSPQKELKVTLEQGHWASFSYPLHSGNVKTILYTPYAKESTHDMDPICDAILNQINSDSTRESGILPQKK